MWAAGKFPLAGVPASLERLALEQSDDFCLRATFLAGLHRRAASEGGPPVRCSVTQACVQSDRDVSWLQEQSPIITAPLTHLHCETTAVMLRLCTFPKYSRHIILHLFSDLPLQGSRPLGEAHACTVGCPVALRILQLRKWPAMGLRW